MLVDYNVLVLVSENYVATPRRQLICYTDWKPGETITVIWLCSNVTETLLLFALQRKNDKNPARQRAMTRISTTPVKRQFVMFRIIFVL